MHIGHFCSTAIIQIFTSICVGQEANNDEVNKMRNDVPEDGRYKLTLPRTDWRHCVSIHDRMLPNFYIN
jgi:hypothetical protein